ncbi:gp297 [Bacillus phage G]|uniref:Gp297 n=1 Tax=Bacillus phage G TaxID=2884420 RepID=G3MA38_9CAUD|nr:gp297 [Bacillus phage G]AEO93556.1 gp297 [Bacillus phage G]
MYFKDKNYGLSKSPNEGVEDSSPQWMDDVFKKLANPRVKKKEHPFAGIDDPILNPDGIGLKKEDK